ncbi:MAG: hypothetical protein AABY07_04050 [Nanoarchaeota archaeon]
MESKRGLLIIALILAFILTLNNNIYTGQGTARPPSGTCHTACCDDGSIGNSKRIDCYEDYIKENPTHYCTGNPDSLNSGCTVISFDASRNIPGAGGLAGTNVKKSERPAKSSVAAGLYLHTCYANTAIRPLPSKAGSVMSNPKDCSNKRERCEIRNGKAECV